MEPKAAATPHAQHRSDWFASSTLKDALAKGGCPVCHALRSSMRRYLFSFLYEGMMSGAVRGEFLKGGGFCFGHFWEAKAIEEECWAEGFGVAILCDNLLDSSLKDIEALAQTPGRLKPTILKIRRRSKKPPGRSRMAPGSGCIACRMSKETEEHYLKVMEELLGEDGFAVSYQRARGLCLRHLGAAAERWESLAALKLIKVTAQETLRQLVAELREFQRKHDYRYKHEPRGSEWSSPERAIEFLVGPRVEIRGLGDLRKVPSERR